MAGSSIKTFRPKSKFTPKYIRSILSYDEKSGNLYWKYRTDIPTKNLNRWNAKYANKKAGYKAPDGRISIEINKDSYLAHRIIWVIKKGRWPKRRIDHKDGNPSNNRWNNLRPATHAENIRNQKRRITNTSGYKGVSWNSQKCKWRAQIRTNRKTISVGFFSNKKDAYAAYCNVAAKMHGQFARFE